MIKKIELLAKTNEEHATQALDIFDVLMEQDVRGLHFFVMHSIRKDDANFTSILLSSGSFSTECGAESV